MSGFCERKPSSEPATRVSAIDPSVYSTTAMPALTKSSTAAIASGIPVRAATVSTSIAGSSCSTIARQSHYDRNTEVGGQIKTRISRWDCWFASSWPQTQLSPQNSSSTAV